MAIIYRTDGAWGSGKGANLAPAEVDGNFYDINTRVTSIEDNPVEPIAPIAINIEGSAFTMGLSNGDTLGPITLTMPMPTWRGDWNATLAYNELDFFVAPDGGLGAVMIPHTSAATFDWGALDPGGTGLPVYRQLIGGSGTTSGIADLIDVALAGQADHDMLVWDAAPSLWRNQTPAVVNTILPAFGGSTGSAAGLKGLVPAPAAGDDAAGKVLGAGGAWVVPAGGSGGSTSLAGLSDVAIVSPINLSLLQYSSVDGKWHNQTLATLGAGTVTHIDTGAGLTGGPITGTGSIAIAPIATLDLLANVTPSSAAPAGVSLSTLLDAVLGTARGSVLWRSATGWVALTAGTAGQFLRTGGAGADVTWGTPSGAGTVTQVNSGTGLTGGPITATGTLSLATVSDSQVLANISGATAAPTGTTLTLLLDHALGATQGMIVYRGAASWTALAPGASGAVLTSGGAAANPSWVTGSGSGTVTTVATGTGLIGGPITGTGTISFATVGNQTLLANISGATAAPSPSTMSAIMDAVFASARGSVIYRGAAGWAALAPGTAGQVLTTAGASADPAWAAAAGASISIGDTPPGSPSAGAMWWDSVGGQLYLWFNDGSSSQWVPASNQPGPQGATGATGPAGSANMSGMTAGQLPVAATATSVTSSIALPLAVANGGTGSTTAPAALTALGAAPLASPTFTGDPRAPTPATADNDTSIATTAYVQAQGYATNSAMATADNLRVLKAGDTMTGILDVGATLRSTGSAAPAAGSGIEVTFSGGAGYVTAYNHTGAAYLPLALTGLGITIDGKGVPITVTSNVSLAVASGITPAVDNNCYCGSPTNAFYQNNSHNYATISDPAQKTDIAPPPVGALANVMEIQPYTYRWKTETADAPLHWGFMAPDVRAAMGEDFAGAMRDEESGVMSLAYNDLTAVLWRAVQELAAKVAALEGKPA